MVQDEMRRGHTHEEVLQMARHLGMNVTEDAHLLWIARSALEAPMPEGWSEATTDSGERFFVDSATGTSSWRLPTDEQYRLLYEQKRRELPSLRPGSVKAPSRTTHAAAPSVPIWSGSITGGSGGGGGGHARRQSVVLPTAEQVGSARPSPRRSSLSTPQREASLAAKKGEDVFEKLLPKLNGQAAAWQK
eukprot:6211913-Pleurochrysis_carterae.AAC.1